MNSIFELLNHLYGCMDFKSAIKQEIERSECAGMWLLNGLEVVVSLRVTEHLLIVEITEIQKPTFQEVMRQKNTFYQVEFIRSDSRSFKLPSLVNKDTTTVL